MNPADEMVPKREASQRQLDVAGSLKEQLRAAFEEFERPSHQSNSIEDLHGSDDRLDEPLPTTLKDFQRPGPQRKLDEEEEFEPVERDNLRPGITSYPDHEVLERQANYDLSVESRMPRRSSRGFTRYLVAILIGVSATLAWQSYGDVAKQIIATSAPELGSSPKAKQMIANSIRQLGWTKPPAGSEQQALPVAQAAPTAPAIDPAQVHQMGRDLATLRQIVEQLAAGLDRVTRELGKLEAADVEILAKVTPAPPPPRPAPARKPTPIAPPSSPAPVTPPTSLAPPPDQ